MGNVGCPETPSQTQDESSELDLAWIGQTPCPEHPCPHQVALWLSIGSHRNFLLQRVFRNPPHPVASKNSVLTSWLSQPSLGFFDMGYGYLTTWQRLCVISNSETRSVPQNDSHQWSRQWREYLNEARASPVVTVHRSGQLHPKPLLRRSQSRDRDLLSLAWGSGNWPR